jgi:muramidase (phage lysozyme)
VYELDLSEATANLQQFQRLFQNHDASVRNIGATWAGAQRSAATAGKSASGYFKQFEAEFANLSTRATKAAKDQAAAMQAVSAEAKRAATWQGQLVNFTTKGAAQMRDMARQAKSFGSSIAEATRWVLKITGVTGLAGGIVGLGGLWGLDRLAGGAASRQFTALGSGVTTGQLQAAQIAYGRFFDPNQILGNIAATQSDWSRRWAFSGLGIDQRTAGSQSAGQLLPQIAARAAQIFANSDRSEQFAQAHGLLQFFSMEDLRRLAAQQGQLGTAAGRYSQYTRDFSLSDDTQKAWRDFYDQLRAAGDKISNTFIDTFAKSGLTDSLTELSSAAADAVKTFLSAPELKGWMHELAEGTKEFASYITSDNFKQNIRDFVHDIGLVAKSLHDALQWLGVIPDPATQGDNSYIIGGPGFGIRRDNRSIWQRLFSPPGPVVPPSGPPDIGGWWRSHAPTWLGGSAAASNPAIDQAFAASGLPSEAQAFMRDIASGEATRFNELAGGGTFNDYSTFPNWAGVPSSIPGKLSHGAGFFQDETGTWQKIQAGTGLTDFSPTSQIRGNWWWAQKTYHDASGRDLLADLRAGKLDPAGRAALGTQWARGAIAGGSRYAHLLEASGSAGAVMPGWKTLGSKYIFGTATPPPGAGGPGFDWSGHESAVDLARVRAAIKDNMPPLTPDPDVSGLGGSSTMGGGFRGAVAGGHVGITVQNQTGGSAIISTNQLSQGP